MAKRISTYVLCAMCYEQPAEKNGLCRNCNLINSAAYNRGLGEAEFVYGRMVGTSQESFEETGKKNAGWAYKRESDRIKFLAGWMHGYDVFSKPHGCMVLEVRDGVAGWAIGEHLWTNDWVLARREAEKMKQFL